MKDCRDCAHYRPDEDWLGKYKDPKNAHEYSKCHRTPQAFESSHNYCATEREYEHECGVGARYFKLRDGAQLAHPLSDDFLHDEFAFWFAPDRWKGGDNLRDPGTVAFWMTA